MVERLGSDDAEEEDGPDWMFESDEVRSKDPSYVFCPAVHRKQLLHAVREMYLFCHQRGLREVWGYLSRLRTTMGSENFWRQLKHNFLHHLIRPRLDQLVWIPVIARSNTFEDDYRSGRSKSLTTYQQYFKRAWKAHAEAKVSGRTYQTNVSTWQCNCGRQKFDAHGLCKHLVQAVPSPPLSFWRQVIRTIPLYMHPALQATANTVVTPTPAFADVDAGSITDGDDHKWMGNSTVWEGGGGRRTLDDSAKARALLGKRRERSCSASSDSDLDEEPRWRSGLPDASIAGGDVTASGQRATKRERILALGQKFTEAHDILISQADKAGDLWIDSVLNRHNGAGLGKDVVAFMDHIHHFETSRTRCTTWPRNKPESQVSRDIMGYHFTLTS